MKNIPIELTPTLRRVGGYACALCLLLSLCLAQPGQPVTPPASTPGPTSGSAGSLGPAWDGAFTLFTCDSALYTVFSQLAVEFNQVTGTQITVRTLQEGQTCREALLEAARNGDMPTLFCMHSQADMEAWENRLYDLKDTAVVQALCQETFALSSGDRILAVGADVDGYGLLYNASLLAKAGFTRTDIASYTDLETACQFITSKSFVFKAFSAPDFAQGQDRDLASILAGSLGAELRSFWDLYIHSGGTGTQGLAQFQEGYSVFYVGGSWEHEQAAVIGSQNLDILPLYGASGGAMRYAVNLAWGLDSLAEAEDIRLALAFLGWLVTAPEEGTAPVDRLGLMSPFRDSATYQNTLEKKLRGYMNTEPALADWSVSSLSEQQLISLCIALTQYSQDPTDDAWTAVEAILEG